MCSGVCVHALDLEHLLLLYLKKKFFFTRVLPPSEVFSAHRHLIVFCVYSWLPLCILNALWPLSISHSKPIKVSSNQEMVSAVVSCWYSHSSLSGSTHWPLTCTVLYFVSCLRGEGGGAGSHLCLSCTTHSHSLWQRSFVCWLAEQWNGCLLSI